MKPESISPLRKYVLPFLVVVVIILIVPFVLIPQLNAIKEKNLKVKAESERLAFLEQKLEDLRSIDETEETVQLLEVEKSMPTQKKVTNLLVGVRNLASAHGLLVAEMNFKPGPIATNSATPSVSKTNKDKQDPQDENFLVFTTTVFGDFAQAQSFIEELEKVKRLTGVRTVEGSRESDGPYKFKIEMIAPFKSIRSCPSSSQTTGCPDIVASPLPPFSSAHRLLAEVLNKFTEYTNIVIPLVPTGVVDPFK